MNRVSSKLMSVASSVLEYQTGVLLDFIKNASHSSLLNTNWVDFSCGVLKPLKTEQGRMCSSKITSLKMLKYENKNPLFRVGLK